MARRRKAASPGRVQALLNVALNPSVPWFDYAACREVSPDLFFPEKGESSRPAKRICLGCSVRDSCLEMALSCPERFGVWGGLSEPERRVLLGEVA